MQPGEALWPDRALTSANGSYSFVYQGDGNLVLYRDGTAQWASNTAGKRAGICIMQGDGNLVVYTDKDHAVWASNTGWPASHFVIQNDGNGVIYRSEGTAVWATGVRP
jgi:hypothetical protein